MADNKSFAGTEVDHGSVQKDKNSVSAGVGAEAGAEASSKRGLGEWYYRRGIRKYRCICYRRCKCRSKKW
jgi:hypothetical protein